MVSIKVAERTNQPGAAPVCTRSKSTVEISI